MELSILKATIKFIIIVILTHRSLIEIQMRFCGLVHVHQMVS